MATPSVGKDVLSYCGKCKLTLSHTVTAMTGTTIAKVQCNTCKAIHGFRSSPTAKRTTTRSRAARKPQISVAELWKQEMSKAKGETIPYSIRKSFQVGDVIDHKKFGPGVVQAFVGNEQIEVIFNSDIKTLVHNK
jgi:hypothetical protein